MRRVWCICLCVEPNCSYKYSMAIGEVYIWRGVQAWPIRQCECDRGNKFSLCAVHVATHWFRSRRNIKCNKWHTLAVGTCRNEVFVSPKLWFFFSCSECDNACIRSNIADYCTNWGCPVIFWASISHCVAEWSGRWRNALFINKFTPMAAALL